MKWIENVHLVSTDRKLNLSGENVRHVTFLLGFVETNPTDQDPYLGFFQ